MEIDFAAAWEQAFPWQDYFRDEIKQLRALWDGVYNKTRIPPWAVAEAGQLTDPVKLLVLNEDWCGDATNTLPVLARLAEAVPSIGMRVLKRDEHPHLMDGFLTNGSRAIPLAIILDREFQPIGRWGPRPRELQDFVLREKAAGVRSGSEIYRDVRAWYARDRGETTLREVLTAAAAGLARVDVVSPKLHT